MADGRRPGSSIRPASMGLALFVLLLLLGLSTTLAQAQAEVGRTVPVETYWQQVERALQTVQELDEADVDAGRPALNALAADFETIAAVELADGQQIPLDSGYLVARLQDPEPDLERLQTILRAALAARDRWPDSSHDRQDLIPLAEILARPEFETAQEEPGPVQRLWQRVVDSLLDLLLRISPESAGGLGPLIRVVLTVAGVAVLMVALVFVSRSILNDIVAEVESPATGQDGSPLVSADQALAQARSHSARSDYRSAVRYLYISSLLLLEERDLVRYDRTQTNQEYLRSVADNPELAAILRDVIDVFDRVWYGFQALDQQAFSHYASRVEQLRRQQ